MAACFMYAASFDPAGRSEGVFGYRWLPGRRRLTALGVASRVVENPLCLTANPLESCLYVGDCTADWRSGGAIYAHAVDQATGELSVTGVVDSGGMIPVFLSLAKDGRNLLTANCGPFAPGNEGRTVAVFPVKKDGLLGPAKTVKQHQGASADPERQTSAHPHCIALDAENRFVWVPDLGTDSIWCYRYDHRLGALLPSPEHDIQVPANSGPRTMKFHPSGRHAYLLNEIANTVIVYRYTAGLLEEVQITPTLPSALEDRGGADLIVHPGGRFLFTSNRQQHCVSTFVIDPASGRVELTAQTHTGGKVPRGMTLDPDGRFLLVGNEADDSIVGFQLQEDGELSELGQLAEMPGPACLTFVQTAVKAGVSTAA